MKIRWRVLTVLILVGLGLSIILTAAYAYATLRSSYGVEVDGMSKNIRRLENAIAEQESNIRATTRDWAFWDETYDYLAGKGQDYESKNLKPEDMATIGINYVAIYDRNGKLVLERGFNIERVESAPYPKELSEKIQANPRLTHPENVLDGQSGFLSLAEGGYLVSAYSVFDSNRAYESNGTLVFGRQFSANQMSALEEYLGITIRREDYSAANLNRDFLEARAELVKESNPNYIKPLSEYKLGGYFLVRDIDGKPAWILRIEEPREIYQRTLMGIYYAFFALLIISVFLTWAIYALIDSIVLHRLEQLNIEVSQIGVIPLQDARVSITGNDEITVLAGRLNEMVYRLTGVQDELRQQNINLEKSNRENVAINQALEQASKARDEFFAMMSHELRSPLSAIIGLTEALQDETFGTLNQEQHEMLSVTIKEGNHFLKSIDCILDYVMVEAGKMPFEYDWVMIHVVCEKCVERVEDKAKERKVSILCSMEDPNGRIWTDELQLGRILAVLLENAIAFSKEGGEVGLEVQGKPGKDGIIFAVWDRGTGIPAEDQERIFIPFTQLNSDARKLRGGIGLGLTFATTLAKHLGGKITLESKEGEGSRFMLQIPGMPQEEGTLQTNPFSDDN